MGWTKQQFVEAAFGQLGYAATGIDIPATKMQAALVELDSMIAEWNITPLGYPLPDSQTSSELDTVTQVPSYANSAVYLNLALRIAPTIGKEPMLQTQRAARKSLSDLRREQSDIPSRTVNPDLAPAGQGNYPIRRLLEE